MRAFHILPTDALRPFIDRLWGWESVGNEFISLPTLLPGTGAELYFHYRTPFRYSTEKATETACDIAHLLCLRRKPMNLCAASDVGFIAVRFRAGMLHRFTDVPGNALLDQAHSVEDIWGTDGKMLALRVVGTNSLSERLQLIQAFLTAKLQDQPTDALVERAIARIYRECSAISIQQLAAQMNLGRRQLERRFLALIGQTPAEVRRLSRFQKTIRALMLDHQAHGPDLALAHGYYDQAHFIHDFRKLAMASPQRYLDAARAKTHFYNTQRRTLDKILAPNNLI